MGTGACESGRVWSVERGRTIVLGAGCRVVEDMIRGTASLQPTPKTSQRATHRGPVEERQGGPGLWQEAQRRWSLEGTRPAAAAMGACRCCCCCRHGRSRRHRDEERRPGPRPPPPRLGAAALCHGCRSAPDRTICVCATWMSRPCESVEGVGVARSMANETRKRPADNNAHSSVRRRVR